ncbi:MAG: serine/threonine protein kinase, partial [Marmoricola sp.]|nr:serine/threonine protein kinase [Marmoricola sp.]
TVSPVPASQPLTPATRIKPDAPVRPVPPSASPRPVPVAADPAPRPGSRAQQVLQLLGLWALTSAVVAYAPYAGTALVGGVVLVLRTASVTRQRHGRRLMIRGRARWYDVPRTTLSLPGYLLLAFLGALVVVAGACLSGLGLFSLGYLLGQPDDVRMLMAGLGFTPALWWGPGSGRLREMTRGLVTRTSRSEFGGWLVVALGVVGTAVLVVLLGSTGPNWAPALSAPWR